MLCQCNIAAMAIDQSESSTPMSIAQTHERLMGHRHSSLSGNTGKATFMTITMAAKRLQCKENIYERTRNLSGCSETTTTTDTSGFGSDYSVSDSDSDVSEYFSYTSYSRSESPDLDLITKEDIEIDNMQE